MLKSTDKYKVPYITTLVAAMAAARAIEAYQGDHGLVKSVQSYHRDIKHSLASRGGSIQ